MSAGKCPSVRCPEEGALAGEGSRGVIIALAAICRRHAAVWALASGDTRWASEGSEGLPSSKH